MLTQKEVAERLREVSPIFVAAHQGAAERFKALLKDQPASAAALNATERANFLHGQVRDLVSVGVEPIQGAVVTSWNIFTVAVGDDLLVRFKHLGCGKPANVRTEQQILLAKQTYTEETMALLGQVGIVKPPTTVTCGYSLIGYDISQVLIRRDRKSDLSWTYSLYPYETVAEPQMFPGMEPAKPARVQSKRTRQRIEETGTGTI